MAEPLYAILGATGNVGGAIARKLLDERRRVRVVGRDAARLKPLADRGAEVAVADVQDAAALARAFTGAGAAFVLIPPNLGVPDFRAYQRAVVEALGAALESARVPFVVSLSSIGADRPDRNGPIAGLHELERRLDRLPGAVLHLRPGYFMENLLPSLGMVKHMGLNGSALRADLPMGIIATSDIGEVGARRIVAGGTGKQVQELQGPRDVTMAEVTSALGRAIGKPDLRYVQFPYDEARKGMVGAGLPAGMADLYVEMSRGFNEGAIRSTQPRSAATTTPTTIDTFAATVLAPAYRAL
jgi:uncharacterized protein YbjT (DUF2867 family)